MENLTDILQLLSSHDVDYVIVGGYAVVAHGGTMVTQDIDICCDFSVENLMRLQSALEGIHPVHRMTPKRLPLHLTEKGCRDLKNLYLDTDLGQLDCLGAVLGVGVFSEAKGRSITIELNGYDVSLLSLDALIDAKKAMNRPRDKEAVLQLEAVREQTGLA